MNDIIYTPSARKLKDEILARVSAKVDGNGIGITPGNALKLIVLIRSGTNRRPMSRERFNYHYENR